MGARAEGIALRRLRRFKNNYCTEMCSGSEAGSHLRLIDFSITQDETRPNTRAAGRKASLFADYDDVDDKAVRVQLQVFEAHRLLYHSA